MCSNLLLTSLNLETHSFRTMHSRLMNRRFYPFFKDCIGAIDGTHIPVVVSKELLVQHLCRKSITTQNVMACCDFDMMFTFAIAGWPGSVHDMRVFDDAMTKYNNAFPHPPLGTLVTWSFILSSNCNLLTLTGLCCCRQVLSGGLGVPKPTGLPGSVQGEQVPSPRVSKRQRTTR